MRIAVSYENGEIFQHFGKTETFKVYEIEGTEVVDAQVMSTNGTGHEALAALLAEKAVAVVICGGIGEGAQAALADVGIGVVAGAEGSADAAVEAYLNGTLVSAGVTCSDHAEGGCDGDCGGECGGNCGSCAGCGGMSTVEGPNAGKICKVHYRGTFNDGTQFDSSYDRNEPLQFVCGAGMMIPGFDAAVAQMEVGQIVDVHLMPDEAYGYPNPANIFTVELAQLPGAENLTVGEQVYLYNEQSQPFQVKVTDKTETTITFDANSEMAGKELNFRIELLEAL